MARGELGGCGVSDKAVRLAGGAAIAFVVLILVSAFAGGSPPAADDSVTEIREYFVDHRSGLLIGALLGLVAVPLVIWFAVVLRDLVRGDRLADALGTASLAGLLVTAAVALAGGAILVAAVYVDGTAAAMGDDGIRLVYEAQMLLFASTSAGIALFGLTAALAIRRTAALPAYTMWFGFLAAVANVVAMFSVLGADASALAFIGLIGFALFLLVTGGTMAAGRATLVAPSAASSATLA
jgi:hypothetical protein